MRGLRGRATGMSGSWDPTALPNLTDDVCEIKSPLDRTHNCIAFAAGDSTRWWWPSPDDHWPDGAPREETLEGFVRAFETLGFTVCYDDALEAGCDKIAVFAKDRGDGRLVPTHAAFQLADGRWASKLGKCEDVAHATVEAVHGPAYGTVIRFLARPKWDFP
jgi:hypothetical protein